MNTMIENIKGLFSETPQTPQLTRAQARKLIFNAIDPSLKQQGFIHKKGNNLWRISENKSDVIELRFLTLDERRQFKLPESTFSLLYGCYYHFIPDIYEGQFIHKIPELITPREVDCHYRENATRAIKQQPKKMDISAWHLEEPEERQKLVLDDVVIQLESGVFPILNRLMDVQEWIRFLENDEGNLGTGKKDSLTRHFLLGFSYNSINEMEQATTYWLKAKQMCEEIIKQFSKQVIPASDIRKRLELIRNNLAQL